MRALQHTESSCETFLARADTRAKVAVSVLASLTTIFLGGPEAQAFLFAASAVYALGMRRPFLLLASYAIVVLMLLAAYGCATLMHKLAPGMPLFPLRSLLVPFLRLLVMVNVILPIAFTTRIQSLLGTLKSVRLPFCIYIPMAVMIRSIPSFIFDIKQIAEALKIRGFSFSPKKFILHPVLCVRFLSIPLLFRSLKTSEDLGIAAELKGLSANRRHVPYKKAAWQKRDTLLLGAAVTVAVLALLCNIHIGSPVRRMH